MSRKVDGVIKYARGDKFEIKTTNFVLEIQSVFPAGQAGKFKELFGFTNVYGVLLNGYPTFFSQEVLDLITLENKKPNIIEKPKPVEKVVEKVVEKSQKSMKKSKKYK